ncbi:hypothetical protein B0H13DRAFT_1857205 [Mycena leptocephala]|nr:hypothetical protein B0H13DRAFT_1857205 [Mycena leptocephala]
MAGEPLINAEEFMPQTSSSPQISIESGLVSAQWRLFIVANILWEEEKILSFATKCESNWTHHNPSYGRKSDRLMEGIRKPVDIKVVAPMEQWRSLGWDRRDHEI